MSENRTEPSKRGGDPASGEEREAGTEDARDEIDRGLDGDSGADEDFVGDGEDDGDLDLLVALGELDAEAAVAYRVGASAVDDVAIAAKLEEFAADHVRHVRTINGFLAEVDGPEIVLEDLEEGSSSISMLAAAVAGMGDRATLLVMIANEQLTNSVCPSVMELPFEEDVLRTLERHANDERRHLEWLLDRERMLRDRGVEVGMES